MNNPKAVIVWDFDGGLFNAQQYRLDYRSALAKLGVSERTVRSARKYLYGQGKHFSMAGFTKALHARGALLSRRAIYGAFHQHLATKRYYDPAVDQMLHRLKQEGFQQHILSLGMPAFQRKRIFKSCGKSFKNHFTKIQVTTRPKYLALQKIRRQYKNAALLFIDDTKENLELAQKHVPNITTVHYSNSSGHTLKILEKKILQYAAKR